MTEIPVNRRASFKLDARGLLDDGVTSPAIDWEPLVRQSLRLNARHAPRGQPMRWGFEPSHTGSLVVHVQSQHVQVMTDDPLKLGTGWHWLDASTPLQSFMYLEDQGVLLFREYSNGVFRWVPFAYRATDVAEISGCLQRYNSPEMYPTTKGYCIVSKFGQVFMSRSDPAGNGLVWERLYSPWPLYCSEDDNVTKFGLIQLRAPNEVPTIAALELETAKVMTFLMEAAAIKAASRATTPTSPMEQAILHSVVAVLAEARYQYQNESSRVRLVRGDSDPEARKLKAALDTMSDEIGVVHRRMVQDTAWHPHMALGKTIATKLDSVTAALHSGARDSSVTDAAEAVSSLCREFMTKVPDSSFTDRITAFVQQARALIDADSGRAESAGALKQSVRLFETALESMDLALSAWGLPALEVPLEVTARISDALNVALVPFLRGSSAQTVARGCLERTVTLLTQPLVHQSVQTLEQRRSATALAMNVFLALVAIRSQEGEATYSSRSSAVRYVERRVLRDAVHTHNMLFVETWLSMFVTASLDELERSAAREFHAQYTSESLRQAHLFYLRELVTACRSLLLRAQMDMRVWSDTDRHQFAVDFYNVWVVGAANPSDEMLSAEGNETDMVRASLVQRALLLARSYQHTPEVAVSPDTPESAAVVDLLSRLAQVQQQLETAGVPAARMLPDGSRVLQYFGVDPQDEDVTQVNLRYDRPGVDNTRYLRFVAPSDVCACVTAMGELSAQDDSGFTKQETVFPPSADVWAPPVSLAGRAMAAVVEETTDALWHSAAVQATRAARDVLLSSLKRPLKLYPGLASKIRKLLESTYGEAVLGYVLGVVLAATRDDARSQRLAAELRIEGEAGAMTAVINPLRLLVVAHLDQVLDVADRVVAREIPDVLGASNLPALEAPHTAAFESADSSVHEPAVAKERT